MRKCIFWRNVQNLCKSAKFKMIHGMIVLSYDDEWYTYTKLLGFDH